MVELADTIDLGSIAVRFESSSLSLGTKKINFVISNKNSTFDIIKYRVVRLAARQLTPTQLTTVRLRHHPLTLLLNKKKTFPIRVL